MFEIEAEEFVPNINWHAYSSKEIREEMKRCYRKGAEKANEWHFPSKGELPKEDTAEEETLYLLWFGLDDSDYITGLFSRGRFWCFDSGWFEASEVVAWKEIVRAERPKESK